jgi:Spy/CpxP family protein refolding chaperone
MRSRKIAILSVILAGCLTGPVRAQFNLTKDGSRGATASQIVKRRDVQKELNLTLEQVQKLKDLDERTRQAKEADFEQLAKLDPKARDDKRMEIVRSTNQLELAEVKKILTPDQTKRLMEVTYQIAYVTSFRAEHVVESLKLTKEQQEKIRGIMQGTILDMREMFQSTSGGLAASREKVDALREKAMHDTLALLTADQKQKWAELQGKPFDIKPPPKPTESVKPREDVVDVAKPSEDARDLEWVMTRVDQWQPAPEERKMDRIGWADGIIPALRLARANNRPVFIFTLDGELAIGRC